MFIRNGLFSSESVSEGHPDKLADRISDAVLDDFLKLDPQARVACEILLGPDPVGDKKTKAGPLLGPGSRVLRTESAAPLRGT
jgi:hypothetical protein